MSQAKYEPAKDTAKKIRKRLKQEFPDAPAKHFSVTSKTYSGGSSISVRWTDYPLYDDVDKIVRQYKSASYDGMVDMQDSHGYIDPEDGLRYYGADYIQPSRDTSDERHDAIQQYIDRNYNKDDMTDHWMRNSAARQVDKLFGADNELLPGVPDNLEEVEDVVVGKDGKYPAFHERNYKRDKKVLLREFAKNVPLSLIDIPKAAINDLGQVHMESGTIILTSDSGTRDFAMAVIEPNLKEEEMKKIAKETGNIDDYEKALLEIIYEEFKRLAVPVYKLNCYEYAKQVYEEEVNDVFDSFVKKGWLLEDMKTEYLDYLNFLEVLNSNYNSGYIYSLVDFESETKRTQNIVRQYVREEAHKFKHAKANVVEKATKQKEAKEQPKKPSSPDELASNTIISFLIGMPAENKERLTRILTKNDKEVMKTMSKNPNLMQEYDGRKGLIARYENKVDPTKVFYQTPYGLWVVYNKNGSVVIESLYRLGVDSIADSVKVAKSIVVKYKLNTALLWFANKMYLRN